MIDQPLKVFHKISRLESTNGTAISDLDYNPIDQDFEIPSGVKFMDFDVGIIDNEIPEPDKVFFLRLSVQNESNTAVILGQKKMCTITIIDDDGKA